MATEGRVLNRIVRWAQDSSEIEPDQRHVDILVKELNLEGAKRASSPGEPEQKGGEDENAQLLEGGEVTRCRALAARANYLAADRTDMMVRQRRYAGAWRAQRSVP